MAIVVFEHSAISTSGRLGRILRNHGHRLDVRELHNGDPLPVDLDNVDGVVTCGGPQSANDDSLPWIADELDYLEAAYNAELPIVGICLGSQLLARALNGRVEKMDATEFGWHPVTLTNAGKFDVVHAGVGWTTMQFHSHREHVTRVPDGAQVLARSEHCPIQAWHLGQWVYAFQYHPEFDTDMIRKSAEDDPGLLEESGLTVEELRRHTEEHLADMVRTAERIFERIALLVMPVDRRIAGLHEELPY